MYWSNFLHIYQPPTQTEDIVRKVTDESYRKLVHLLQSYPSARVTLNINASLTEQLVRYGLTDVLDGLRNLAERGQVEFTGSAMYHPILPLIPREEMVRQIELNTAVNRRYLGDVYRPVGFFPPEMCYSFEVADVARDMGFRWIIVDEIAYNGKLGATRDDFLYRIHGLDDFLVFFKERPISAGITYGSFPTADAFLNALKGRLKLDGYLLTGTDGEVYGHHRPGQEKLLEEVFARKEIETCTVSELITRFHTKEEVDPLPSSWSAWEDEMRMGNPYPQWQYKGHDLHTLQWELTNLAIDTVHNVAPGVDGYEEAHHLLDEGLHSCQYWWASCRPWWDVGMIEAGAAKLAQSVQLLKDVLEWGTVVSANRLREEISAKAREWQQTGKAQSLKEEYLREHKEVTSQLTFG